MARYKSNNSYKSSAAFWETPCPHTIKIPYDGSTTTTVDNNFAVAMDYTAALEEESHAQDECILDLEASMNGQTVPPALASTNLEKQL